MHDAGVTTPLVHLKFDNMETDTSEEDAVAQRLPHSRGTETLLSNDGSNKTVPLVGKDREDFADLVPDDPAARPQKAARQGAKGWRWTGSSWARATTSPLAFYSCHVARVPKG